MSDRPSVAPDVVPARVPAVRVARFRVSTGAVLLAALLLPVGAATAYWSALGYGTGTPKAGTTAVTADGASATGLYPGLARTVAVTVRNTGTRTFTVNSLTGGTATLTNASGTCAANAVTLTSQTGLTSPVAAGGSLVMNVTVTMSGSAGDGCQGATFTFPVTVDGRQS